MVLVATFVLADLLLGTPAAAGVTAAATAAVATVGVLMLRSSGRISEQGFIESLKDLHQRSD